MVRWQGMGEERWKAAKERPIVPVPIRVILTTSSSSILVMSLEKFCGLESSQQNIKWNA